MGTRKVTFELDEALLRVLDEYGKKKLLTSRTAALRNMIGNIGLLLGQKIESEEIVAGPLGSAANPVPLPTAIGRPSAGHAERKEEDDALKRVLELLADAKAGIDHSLGEGYSTENPQILATVLDAALRLSQTPSALQVVHVEPPQPFHERF